MNRLRPPLGRRPATAGVVRSAVGRVRGTHAAGAPYAVVAGGGTGGHVSPALAIADALVARGHAPGSIEIVGSRRGPEGALLAGEPYPITLLPGRGISRGRRPRSIGQNAGALAGLGVATVRSTAALVRRRPRVVVSVGGYAAFAPGVAAVLLRIPLVLVNVDAVPGLVHRVLARRATGSAVAFADTVLPRAVVTGTPVRAELFDLDRAPAAVAAARRALGVPVDRRILAVVGGSLGARRINEAVVSLIDRWRDRVDLAVYHVTGRRDWEMVSGAVGDGGVRAPAYRAVPFQRDMALLYQAADLVLCRAGAMTVAELAAAGVPSILVPLPGAPGDHQAANARVLAAVGGAEVIADVHCDAARVDEVASGLLADPARLAGMGAAARTVGRPGAATRVAEFVERCAGVGVGTRGDA